MPLCPLSVSTLLAFNPLSSLKHVSHTPCVSLAERMNFDFRPCMCSWVSKYVCESASLQLTGSRSILILSHAGGCPEPCAVPELIWFGYEIYQMLLISNRA